MRQVNPDRLWQSLMDLARIGTTDKSGEHRLTRSEADRRRHYQFVAWCREARLPFEVDCIVR